MQDLNVIGNNIANVNTKGYKAGRSVFRSALYTQISGGREGTAVVGSKNPSQIGYGANLGSVDVDMSTGGWAPGKPTDLMIDGDGFFLMGDKETANIIDPTNPNTLKSFSLTRVGDFDFGSDGYLVNANGDVVYGFLVIGYVGGEPVYSDQLVPIRKPRQDEAGNIVWPHLEDVIPEGGQEEDAKLMLVDTLYPTDEGGGNDQEVQNPYVQASLTNITIENGEIRATVRSTKEQIVIGSVAVGTVDNPNGVTQTNSSYYSCGAGAGNLAVNMVGGASKSILVANANLPTGEGDDAETFVPPTEYGQTVEYGDATIRLGMRYVNESQITGGENAGDENLNLPYGSQVFDTGSATVVRSGGLEMSKTDLATEIANMITTQRGYQANTRIITVTDSMLEELVNMKR